MNKHNKNTFLTPFDFCPSKSLLLQQIGWLSVQFSSCRSPSLSCVISYLMHDIRNGAEIGRNPGSLALFQRLKEMKGVCDLREMHFFKKNWIKMLFSKKTKQKQTKKETSLQEDARMSSPALSCSVLLHMPKSMIVFSDTYLPVSTRCLTPGHRCSVLPPLSLMAHLSCLFQKHNFLLFKFRGLVTLTSV